MRLTMLTAPCIVACTLVAGSASTLPVESVVGTVVAIQRGKTDTRLRDQPDSADLVEIYMVRADKWSSSAVKPRYFLLEYKHHDTIIEYEKFDKETWRFEVGKASSNEAWECRWWVSRYPPFLPTAFGTTLQLPDPKDLDCFVMKDPPSAMRMETR